MLKQSNERIRKKKTDPTHTCGYKHDVVLLSICSLHLVDNDSCECSPPSYQQRLPFYGLDSLVHEGLIFDKL